MGLGRGWACKGDWGCRGVGHALGFTLAEEGEAKWGVGPVRGVGPAGLGRYKEAKWGRAGPVGGVTRIGQVGPREGGLGSGLGEGLD